MGLLNMYTALLWGLRNSFSPMRGGRDPHGHHPGELSRAKNPGRAQSCFTVCKAGFPTMETSTYSSLVLVVWVSAESHEGMVQRKNEYIHTLPLAALDGAYGYAQAWPGWSGLSQSGDGWIYK